MSKLPEKAPRAILEAADKANTTDKSLCEYDSNNAFGNSLLDQKEEVVILIALLSIQSI